MSQSVERADGAIAPMTEYADYMDQVGMLSAMYWGFLGNCVNLILSGSLPEEQSVIASIRAAGESDEEELFRVVKSAFDQSDEADVATTLRAFSLRSSHHPTREETATCSLSL